jgi:hypothetical protein
MVRKRHRSSKAVPAQCVPGGYFTGGLLHVRQHVPSQCFILSTGRAADFHAQDALCTFEHEQAVACSTKSDMAEPIYRPVRRALRGGAEKGQCLSLAHVAGVRDQCDRQRDTAEISNESCTSTYHSRLAEPGTSHLGLRSLTARARGAMSPSSTTRHRTLPQEPWMV